MLIECNPLSGLEFDSCEGLSADSTEACPSHDIDDQSSNQAETDLSHRLEDKEDAMRQDVQAAGNDTN